MNFPALLAFSAKALRVENAVRVDSIRRSNAGSTLNDKSFSALLTEIKVRVVRKAIGIDYIANVGWNESW